MRTVTRYDALGGSETKTIREMWDENGEQLWTYFNEIIKQYIEFFLSKRLKGRNLEVGGGWYLSYPNSDVVDVSPVCLEYNKAPPERKHIFDLETIPEGAKLPFGNNTFDSATMISVIQYLPNPWKVVGEIERVLKPGSELYIIGGQNAGVRELVMSNGFRNNKEIEHGFKGKGYDTIIEHIPCPDRRTGEFNSVCVAMPRDENGEFVSRIENKKTRLEQVHNFNPRKFLGEFAKAEETVEVDRLRQIQKYPITKHSRSIINRVNKFSEEYSEKTGNNPIFFCNTSTQPEFDMALPDNEPVLTLSIIGKNEIYDNETLADSKKRHNLWFCQYSGYLPSTMEELRNILKNCKKSETRNLFDFLASPKINEPAIILAKEIEKAISSRDLGYWKELYKEVARKLNFVAYQHKQRRRIDDLIEKKRFIESKPELIAEYGGLELDQYIPYLRGVILHND